jgi:hypothetical protein
MIYEENYPLSGAASFRRPGCRGYVIGRLGSHRQVLEQNAAPNAALNTQLLALLREPAKTLDGVTLPTTAAQYTTMIDTALKLRPKGWIAGGSEQLPAAAAGVNCTAHLSLWLFDANINQAGLRMEAFAWGKGNCASVTSAAEARAWGWKLKQIGPLNFGTFS